MIRLYNGIACDFGDAYGLWTWTLAGSWERRNTVDPEQMTVVDVDKDGVEELVVSFSAYGLYYLDESNGWQWLNDFVPEDMKPSAIVARNKYTDFQFIDVPEYGSFDNLRGQAGRFSPGKHMVAVYIKVEDVWWTKPTYALPLTQIDADGFWTCDITTGGNDEYATEIAAFLLPKDINAPVCGPCYDLPDISESVGFINFDRTPNARTISFAGFDWLVKNKDYRAGPGPNYFSEGLPCWPRPELLFG